MDVKFLEDVGYEPPQGRLEPAGGTMETTESAGDSSMILKLDKSRWVLSEDPNERKDSLWIWGLFEEPLYPFLLLKLETVELPLPGSATTNGETDDDNSTATESILPLELYAQLQHRRDKELGVVLSGADVTVRVKETVQADLFGAAQVEIYDEVRVGRLGIAPVP